MTIKDKEGNDINLTEVVATKEFAPKIAEIQKIIRKNSLKDKNGEPVFATDSSEFIESIIDSKRGIVVMYFNKDDWVGFFELTCPDDSSELEEEYNVSKYLPNDDINNMGVAESIVVFPKYRGNHLQAKMFERMEEIAAERGITSLIGTVHPENKYSCDNFDVSGYKTVAEIQSHGGPRFLKYKDVKIKEGRKDSYKGIKY